jgi:hypothetical protein
VTRPCPWVLATVALAIAGPVAPAVAVAAPDPDVGVELSADGTTWAEDIDTPLLDPRMLWHPGDSEVATLWFRNRSGAAARGHAEVTVGPEDTELAEDLAVRTRYDGGAWSAGAVSPTVVVADRQMVRLDIEVTHDPASGNESMDRTVPIAVRVVLAGADAPAPGPPGAEPPGAEPPGAEPPGAEPPRAGPPGAESPGGEPSSPGLAATGAEVLRAAATALALVIAGSWLVVAGRRRGARHE